MKPLAALSRYKYVLVVAALGALLLAQFIRENKQLKDDNDLFV